MCRQVVLGLSVGSLLLLAACGSDKKTVTPADSGVADAEEPAVDQQAPEPDVTPPSATFDNLPQYEGFQGSVELAVTTSSSVDKVELLADGEVVATATAAPFKLTWDTSAGKDGMISLTLKAYAGDASATGEAVPVVVYNDGEVVQWLEAADPANPVIEGEMKVQAGVEYHVKFHWDMPEGVKRVIAVHEFDNPAFEERFTIGIGGCPHSGYPATDVVSKISPVALDFVPPPDGMIPAEMWFSHAGPDNEAEVLGQTAKVSFKTYIFFK